MKRTSQLTFCAVFFLVFGVIAGCGGGSEQSTDDAALQEQFAGVQEAYDALTQFRTDVETGNATVAELEAVKESDRTDEQKAQLEEAVAAVEAANGQLEDSYNTLQERLAEFLTVGLNDAPESELTARALEIYSKAIDQVQSAKSYYEAIGLTPYAALDEKIAELESWRFITPERFDAIKKGMTRDEVIEIVGVPYYQNILEDEAKGIETWLYKKAEGGASAIYFKTKTGKAYDKNADAVKTRVVE
jgi:FtsZ-binding cell division protein ZapB